MCCFSRPVQEVAQTRIFARPTIGHRQVIVYAMNLIAKESLAMILPVPVKLKSDPREFKFINLAAYQSFFEDMDSGFPMLPSPASLNSGGVSWGARAKLEVFKVGAFEASFVPTLSDFDRLDGRFRIDPGVWRRLPSYDRMGFAVFKLKPGRQRVHPMCFAFPREDPSKVFLPTLHIHDGSIHPQEHFDHALYLQGNDEHVPEIADWEESIGWASRFMKVDRTAGILQNSGHVFRRRMVGQFPNQDTYVRLG